MARLPLACSVRGCEHPLVRVDRAFTCPAGHSYDIARNGYVNLLHAQDRRSPTPGDAPTALDARSGLLEAGVGQTILDAFVHRAAALDLTDGVVIDLGCGTGEVLAALARLRTITGIGIDVSSTAIERAARRTPDLTWVVANADRRLPLLDGSVDLALSLHGRRNPQECARVLVPDGFLLVGMPAPDDLIELRAAVQGEGRERDRADAVVAAHESQFVLRERSTARERRRLEPALLGNLLRGTYRGERSAMAARVASLASLEVTLASDLFLFSPR